MNAADQAHMAQVQALSEKFMDLAVAEKTTFPLFLEALMGAYVAVATQHPVLTQKSANQAMRASIHLAMVAASNRPGSAVH